MKKILKAGLVSSSVVSAFCIGMTGVASASSITVSTQGPNSGVSIKSGAGWEGSTTSYTTGSTHNNGWQGGWNDGSDWGGHDPMMWQSKNMSCDEWWGDMMQTMSHYNASNWQRNRDNDHNWQPEGENWQATWSNWNPVLWQEHNQSYGRWYAQMTSYMHRNHTKWQNNWKITKEDTHHEQNNQNHDSYKAPKHHDNGQSQTNHVTGNKTAYVHPQESNHDSWDNNNDSNWHQNNNEWSHVPAYLNTRYLTNRSNSTNNWVSVSSSNSQSVRSGNASSWGNTYSGDVRSGDASANNDVSISLSI